MQILVLNCGSSSVKFKFFDGNNEKVLASGIVEKIPSEIDETNIGVLNYKTDEGKYKKDLKVADHTDAIQLVIDALTDMDNLGVIKDKSDVNAVGHRLVHGAEEFTSSVLIDDNVVAKVTECIKFAPLHNPPNIKGINAARKIFGDIPMVGVFDTAFHTTMPDEAYLYALPYEFYEEHRIRRYGFHGTSHYYVSEQVKELTSKKNKDDLRVISCHLGNGSSIAAIRGGKSMDTSMGFTPLEGVMMGTRCGDLDPAIPLLLQREDFGGPRTHQEVDTLMNKQSGLLGISGVSNDFREIHDGRDEGHKRCDIAIRLYSYKVRKYIGAYMAALGGADCIVFTAGAGENDDIVRELICQDLQDMGIDLDTEKNVGKKREAELLSKPSSKVEIWVIPTDEELVIVRDTKRIVSELA
jgi:acetate kinase